MTDSQCPIARFEKPFATGMCRPRLGRPTTMNEFVTLTRDTNQARGIAQYALDMLQGRHPGPSEAVLARVEQFHLDSIACGVSALAAGANAPTVLRREALDYEIVATGEPSA